jgi:aminocarboxymuconate-semialdehyde decarboxylase
MEARNGRVVFCCARTHDSLWRVSIDVHTHILPKRIPSFLQRFGEGGFMTLEDIPHSCKKRMVRDDGVFFREVEENCFAGASRIAEMDATLVRKQVLSTVPVMFSYWSKPAHGAEVARFLNDDLAATVHAHPDRYLGLGTLPLQDPERACAELTRCMRELGLQGVQIGSHVERPGKPNWNLSAPELFCVFETAAREGAAVFIHPWDMMGQEHMQRYWLPWLVGMPAEESLAICSLIFGGVFERLPLLRVLVAHGGGAFPSTIGRIQHGFDCRPDLVAVDNHRAPIEYLGKFWVDSLVHDSAALREVMRVCGEDRVALGSDYPFPLGEAQPGALIRSMQLGPVVERKLLEDNARAWLGI